MRLPLFAACLTIALAGYACGDDASEPTGSGGAGGTTSTTSAGGSGGNGTGGSGGCAPQPGVDPGPDWICVTDVTGEVVDESGSPVTDVLMTVCGPGGCEPDTTDAAGAFDIEVGFPLLLSDWSLIPHSREYGYFVNYYPFDPTATGPSVDLGSLTLLSYPAASDALVVKTDDMGAPAQAATNGEATIDIPAGVRVNLDFEDVALGDDGKRFFAKKVDAGLQDEFIDPSLGAVALYALAPFDAAFDLESAPGTAAKVQLSFDNTTGLAANTPVQFYQQGSFIVGSLQTALYHPVATGRVSTNGMTIEMDPGEGVEFLTWVAIAPMN